MPKRILHVVGGMNRGGVETWLMHVLRHIDRQSFQMDFMVHTNQPCAYDDEILALGGKIIPCLHPSRPWTYARNFKRILRQYGPYDIVHSHVHFYSGYVLRLARQMGVPMRIAHSHNDTSSMQAQAGYFRRTYLTLMRHWIHRQATSGLACSKLAAAALFGPAWERDPRWQVLHYGIDLTPFKIKVDRDAVLAELGLSPEALVVGHVGSFTEQKNHAFLMEIAGEIARREKNFRLLLIGDGPLRPAIEKQVAQASLTESVVIAGLRADVPRLMLGAMDLFLFPALFEGLPLVLLEAQAAGLPCIFADVISMEVDAVKPLVLRLSLSQSAASWAEAVLAARDRGQVVSRTEALAIVEQSSFNILSGIKRIDQVYGLDNGRLFYGSGSQDE